MTACPGCSASLRFDVRSQKMKCDHCGAVPDPYELSDMSGAPERGKE